MRNILPDAIKASPFTNIFRVNLCLFSFFLFFFFFGGGGGGGGVMFFLNCVCSFFFFQLYFSIFFYNRLVSYLGGHTL